MSSSSKAAAASWKLAGSLGAVESWLAMQSEMDCFVTNQQNSLKKKSFASFVLVLFWSHSCTFFSISLPVFLLSFQCVAGNGFPVEINALDFLLSRYPSCSPQRVLCRHGEDNQPWVCAYSTCKNIYGVCMHFFEKLGI